MDTNKKSQGHTVKLNIVNKSVLSGLKLTQVSLLTSLIALPLTRMPAAPVVAIGKLVMLLSAVVFLMGQVRCCISDVSPKVSTIRISTACSFGALLLPFLSFLSAGLVGLLSLGLNLVAFLTLLMYAAAVSRECGHEDLAKRFQRVIAGLVLAPLALLVASTFHLGPVLVIAAIIAILAVILSPISYIRGVAALGQRAALVPC